MIATCPQSKTLHQYSLGKLSDHESDELTDHLRDCHQCQQRLAESEGSEDTFLGQLRDSTVNHAFQDEADCQIAMARALGALAETAEIERSDDPLIPRLIGEYEIVRRIGQGGMGSVYLAQHTKLNRTVAVKVLAAHRLSDPRMHDRFETEMRVIGSLNHPNIVVAHDAREVDGVAMLVTEWIDGLDLREILHRLGPLSVANASAVVCELTKALRYADEQGLVHRDMKPSNVMINRTGETKLLDLGLARLCDVEDDEREATATGQAIGTADYVSPEQVNDARSVDGQADVYGLGCTLFKLLTGRAPFEDAEHATAFSKMTAHVSDNPPSLRSIRREFPTSIVTLVARMLAKSPQERPSLHDVQKVLASHVGDADLVAMMEEAVAAGPRPAGSKSVVSASPETKPFWKKEIPLAAAIAIGFFGLLIGLFAGVTLTIRHADGTSSEFELPDNTKKVVVGSDGDVDVTLREANGGKATTASNGDASLSDAARFSGVWRVERTSRRGVDQDIPPGEATIAFHAPLFAIMGRDEPVVGTLVIDEKTQSLELTERTGQKSTKHAIYRFLDDQRLSILLNESPEGQRPDSFANPDSASLLTLSKVTVPENGFDQMQFLRNPGSKNLLAAALLLKSWKGAGQIDDTAISQMLSQVDAIRRAQKATNQVGSFNNLKHLGIAFHNYHDVYRRFPASASTRSGSGEKGQEQPPYSWRVAILPFVECLDLYEQYRFDEPWDSEANKKLLDKMPAVFRSPDAPKNSKVTSYVGFTGVNTVLGDSVGVSIREILDGTSNTILLVEAETDIPWTKPDDMAVTDDPITIKGPVLMTDGSVQRMPNQTSEILRGLIIHNDGAYLRR